jgi:RNA polymerase sigma factor (sigma-70 family)
MKDQQIIQFLKAGNYSKASEKLYAYFPVIKKLVLKNSGSKQDAEDVYQEALIILMNKLQNPEFKLTSSLNTYVYSVCRFLWNDELKKKNKKISIEIKGNESFLEEDVIPTKDEHDQKLAEKAFDLLGEKCKDLLRLFYFKKMNLKDVAAKLGFGSENVAKNQKYRCLEKAKENLRTLKNTTHE